MGKKHIVIVGAGPGGLAAGMILAKRGFKVSIYEKDGQVGGRNQLIELGDYKFDTGPTFLILSFILKQVFKEAGKKVEDYLEFRKLDPLYRLQFADKTLLFSEDDEKTREEVKRKYPGNENGLDEFNKNEKVRFEKIFPCLQKKYSTFFDFFTPTFLKAATYMYAGKSIMHNLAKYFDNEDLRIAFSFQAKYLGMSPWKCPALFTILSYMEHSYGIYHVIGGLNKISQQMAEVIKENGGEIILNRPVKQLLIENKKVKGLILEDESKVYADDVIINADFSYAMSSLVPEGVLKKYSSENLKEKKYSCSTFLIYLGLKKKYDLNHHNIIFSKDYHGNINDIFDRKVLSDDPSFYIQNACVTDQTLAPEGHSTFYILVPVPNNRSGINWDEKKEEFKDKIIQKVIDKTGFTDLKDHIEVEKIISPQDWEQQYNVYIGAEFNLAHTIDQMLYFRPHNKFEELKNCYLVGGGTHPGSGLPTIYESGRITADMISDHYGVEHKKTATLDEMKNVSV
jgi:phytoene desaturase